MILVIEFFKDNYWRINSVGTEASRTEYERNLAPGQKIVDSGPTWPEGEHQKEDLLWDDNAHVVMLFPADLKLEDEKEKLLTDLEGRISKSNLLSPAEIKVIVNGIKNAGTIQGAKEAAANFDASMKAVARSIVRN